MPNYEVKVTVDYYVPVEDVDSAEAAEEYAYYHFGEYAHTSEVYECIVDEIESDDEEEVEE